MDFGLCPKSWTSTSEVQIGCTLRSLEADLDFGNPRSPSGGGAHGLRICPKSKTSSSEVQISWTSGSLEADFGGLRGFEMQEIAPKSTKSTTKCE